MAVQAFPFCFLLPANFVAKLNDWPLMRSVKQILETLEAKIQLEKNKRPVGSGYKTVF